MNMIYQLHMILWLDFFCDMMNLKKRRRRATSYLIHNL